MIEKINFSELLKNIEYDSGDIVFLSGSLIEGIGNSSSDIDVFVLSNDISKSKKTGFSIDTKSSKVDFKTIFDFGVDIEYWSIHEVVSKLESLNKIDFDDTNVNLSNLMDINFLSFIHRIKVGKCIYNNDKFNELYSSINFNNYFRHKIRTIINLVENQYEDIIGNMDSKRYKTALYIAKKAVVNASYAYLLHNKISLDRDKWVISHFEKLSKEKREAKEIFDRFEEITFLSSENFETETEKSIEFINEIVDIIQNSEEGL